MVPPDAPTMSPWPRVAGRLDGRMNGHGRLRHSTSLGTPPGGTGALSCRICFEPVMVLPEFMVRAPRDRSEASLAAKRINPSPNVCFPSLWLWTKSPSASSSKSDFCDLQLKPHWCADWSSTAQGAVWASVSVVVCLNKLSSESQIRKVWSSLIDVLGSHYKAGYFGWRALKDTSPRPWGSWMLHSCSTTGSASLVMGIWL